MKVSVLIATYQRKSDLTACLQAIAQQTVAEVCEVCVVNDGGAPIAEIVQKFPGLTIRHMDLAQNVGHVAARNQALGMATGEMIAVCDDDDRWLPMHIESLLELMTHTGDDFAFCDAELVWLDRTERGLQSRQRAPFAWADATALLPHYNPIVPSSVLYRRTLHERLGRFDEAMGHYWDWDWFLRSRTVTRLSRHPVCTALYGVYTDNANQSAIPEHMSDRLQALVDKHYLAEIPSSNFARMLSDPVLAPARTSTVTPWDGQDLIWNSR